MAEAIVPISQMRKLETNSLKNFPQVIQASKSQRQNQNSGLLSPAPALVNAKIQSNHQSYHTINVLIFGGGNIHTENLSFLPFLSVLFGGITCITE